MRIQAVRPLLIFMATLAAFAAPNKKSSSTTPFPVELAVGRHTFFDFGPPFDYYEIFSVRPQGQETIIQRITLTPPGIPCLQAANLEVATATTQQTLADLLNGVNPCAIPEKALKKERKRCKNCLVFSGADATLAVTCGNKQRLLRSDFLVQDIFGPSSGRPQYASWYMEFLGSLDQLLGDTIMDRPAFGVGATAQAPPADLAPIDLAALKTGKFDILFPGSPHKPSNLLILTENPPTQPNVELVSITPLRSTATPQWKYPPLARAAGVEGDVEFAADLAADGSVRRITMTSGHPLFEPVVTSDLEAWKFSSGTEGHQIRGIIAFRLNCSAASR